MGTHISGGSLGGAASAAAKPIVALDTIITTLGSTKTSFWPFLEASGSIVQTYKEQDNPGTVKDVGSDGLYPFAHPSGVHSYHFNVTEDQHILVADNTSLSILAGAAMSIGCWIYPQAGSTVIMSKWETSGNDVREYKLELNGDPDVVFTQEDDTENANIVTTTDTALSLNLWQFIVVTFSASAGDETDYAIYVDGSSVAETGSASGTWAENDNTATDVVIGGQLTAGVVASEFDGRIALPFITGAALSAANVATLYGAGRTLLGV